MRASSPAGGTAGRSILALIAASALLASACSATGAGPSASVESDAPAASASPADATASPSTASSGGGRGDYSYEDPATDAPAASEPATAVDQVTVDAATGAVGAYLTGLGGRTLYTFKPDSANTSTCDGGCAEAWPPFTVPPGTELTPGIGVDGTLTTFERADGTLQVAYDGAPLYYFANDTAPGDTNGQGLGDNWFVAAP